MRTLGWCLLLVGCDVYSADLLDGGSNDARVGCPRGLADCDRNGTCESDLATEETCGSCTNTCQSGATCVAGVLCVEGDVRDFDVGPLPDAGRDAGRDAGPVDSGVDGPPLDAPVDSGIDPCTTRPPPRPAIGDSADMSSLSYALRNIVINQGGGVWEGIGYDLDGQCTDSIDDPFICTPPAADFPPFDGPGGVDNTFGDKVLGLLNTYDPTFQATVRAIQDMGITAMVRIKDWNYEDDDPMVDVELIRTLGLPGGATPAWDGTDALLRSDDSYNPSTGDALLRDEGAYIVDRTLVARFPDRQPIVVPFLGGTSFTIRLTDSVMTADIAADRRSLNNLVFQGRFARVDMENGLEAVGFCVGSSARAFIDVELNQSVDVRAFAGGGGDTCDAISMAFEYIGTRVEEGDLLPAPIPDPVVCLP